MVALLATPKTVGIKVEKKGKMRYMEDSDSILPPNLTANFAIQSSTNESMNRPDSKRDSRSRAYASG